MSVAPDRDVIVVGAGHNGLAATALLAKRGRRFLCPEKKVAEAPASAAGPAPR